MDVRKFYNNFAGNYDNEHLNPYSISGYVDRLRKEIISPKLDGSYGVFLDCACGTGYYLDLLPNSQRMLFGSDISHSMVKICQQKMVGDMLYVGSFENIPFKNDTFDVILCINSFHYTLKPEESLIEMKRTLKDSGKIILTYFNLINFRAINSLRKFIFTFDRNTPQAQEHRYTEASFEKLVSKSGLMIKNKERLNYLPFSVTGKSQSLNLIDKCDLMERYFSQSFLRYFANEIVVELVKR